MDLAQLTNAPRPVTFAGREFTISALTLREWGSVQAWIKANTPGPMESLKSADLDGLSPYMARQLAMVAIKEQQAWPPRVGSQEWFNAVSRVGRDDRIGDAVVVQAILSKHHPEIGYAEAEALWRDAPKLDGINLVLIAMGVEPDGPKADRAGA